MRAIDLINPFKRPKPFQWRGPVVVSSIAGLGDLFIHLPLISGIVNACRERGLRVVVALRPAHMEIGARCGFETMPFDSGMEDFFKKSRTLRFSLFAKARRMVREIAPALWIDLTGNAINAAMIKACGVAKLAARVTRGGKSFIDHSLPHFVQENEYTNRHRGAAFLGCNVDFELPNRIEIGALNELAHSVVLCITTASRWKNWPLKNFRALIETFPQQHFTIVGFRRELLPEEREEFEQIARKRNVSDCTDRLTASELVDLIAHCKAVVTNDTSAAHIANFFRRPGAVLFGPVSPQTFAAPNGLHVFHDTTCPFHPCVQWRCRNQKNWCMRKITVDAVSGHLADIVGSQFRSASFAEPSLHPPNNPNRQWQAQLPV
jgi:ADP-heptose:LPS heptosyltransferase